MMEFFKCSNSDPILGFRAKPLEIFMHQEASSEIMSTTTVGEEN